MKSPAVTGALVGLAALRLAGAEPTTINTVVTQEQISGEPVLILANGALRVTVMPSRGGKIVSVVDRSDGRERLWQKPDQRDFPKPGTGANYGEFNCSGVDECLPTIAPCEWRGRKLTDHGEVWTEETKATLLADGVRIALDCPISPLRFERALRLVGDVIQCDYALTNTGKEPWEYQWAFHGLLAVEEDDRIVLPGEVKHLIADKSRGLSAPLPGEPWSRIGWPIGSSGLDYSALQTGRAGEKSSLKAYTPRLSEGWCALHNRRTGRLWALAFDPKDTPHVGLWINNGAWRGYRHAALEPCNGGPDRLDVAVREWKWFTTLQPGETRKWWLKIVVKHDASEFRGLTPDGHLK